MKDRTPRFPGRVILNPVSGQANTFDVVRADEPLEEGTPINKQTLLTDTTAAEVWPDEASRPAEPTVNAALNKLGNDTHMLRGSGEPTTNTAGVVGQKYFDEVAEAFYVCVGVVSNGSTATYVWVAVGSGNEAAFGTRGPIIITESSTFNIKDYGLKIGDKVNVICIGGGGGGGAGGFSNVSYNSDSVGTAGKAGGTHAGYGSGGDSGQGSGKSGSGAYSFYSGGGGGSGYLTQGTITLQSESVAVTIGSRGAGADGSGMASSNSTAGAGGNGGTTSFGAYLSASGGNGGGRCGMKLNTSDWAYSANGVGAAGAGGISGDSGQASSSGGTYVFASGAVGYVVHGFGEYEAATDNSVLSTGGACLIWY